MYSNGDDDTHMGYNHVVAITNNYLLQQERFQLLQDYRDQFIAYRKLCELLIEDMKNDLLRKKDPLPKTITEACHVISKWKNHYGRKYNNNKIDQMMILPSQQ